MLNVIMKLVDPCSYTIVRTRSENYCTSLPLLGRRFLRYHCEGLKSAGIMTNMLIILLCTLQAFGATETMTDRTCIHSNGRLTADLSARDLLSCCHFCGFGCHGGYPPLAWNYWKSYGLVTGGSLENPTGCEPYPFPKCSHHGPQQTNTMYDTMTNGPVEAMFQVFEDFFTYSKGIYHHVTGTFVGYHAIRMLGWGEENGERYWLLWGEDGFFRILRGVNESGIESRVNAGMPFRRFSTEFIRNQSILSGIC
ncbi:unnamed protein product [Echinostoma caproni]|uniref:Pept_C1 domain-containing protein n=1 Tax=Echinostoma caproni TaxID=27848 RepID=A0A183AZ16_9TREM|nr:unnamed protein product [Echinostoma caproni]